MKKHLLFLSFLLLPLKAFCLAPDVAMVTDSSGNASTSSVTTSQLQNLPNIFKAMRTDLKYIDATHIGLVDGLVTGTSGDVSTLYRDGVLCTTNNSAYTTLDIGRVASLSGTKQSGLTNGTIPNNVIWFVYSVKAADSQDNILIATSTKPSPDNYALLNGYAGVNGWTYEGAFAYYSVIVSFSQHGNRTILNNTNYSGNALNSRGILFSTTASGVAAYWTYSAGTGYHQLPSTFSSGIWTVGCYNSSWFSCNATGQTDTTKTYWSSAGYPGRAAYATIESPATDGINTSCTVAGSAEDVYLTGWVDGYL